MLHDVLLAFIRSVAGIQMGCCGRATKPDWACIHDQARRMIKEYDTGKTVTFGKA